MPDLQNLLRHIHQEHINLIPDIHPIDMGLSMGLSIFCMKFVIIFLQN